MLMIRKMHNPTTNFELQSNTTRYFKNVAISMACCCCCCCEAM